ncbi:MAG: hypothetical protein DUD27_05690 [Lachnospiraceae bacterium]|uniref:Fibronectin type-III domain-containing protein n=1 Tax=Candidatus Weimeria bifida TaxID=2599074 RepID=A0A6N7J153_9FIRM|nr:hypothetical protein [Candidatus Weimeria bifida]RRF96157.1 MAG: hypothetical protein DUD27_05690 [Lachnospiraceae bacterium]
MKKQITAFFLAAALALTSIGGSAYLLNTNKIEAEAKDTAGSAYDPLLVDQKDKVVVIDAGHGGGDPGAYGSGYHEKDLTLKIAKSVKTYLQKYARVRVYLSRKNNTYVSLTDRTAYAASVGADAFVSVHLNAASGKAPNGCEVYYPNNHYDYKAFSLGKSLAQNIQKKLKSLGLCDRQIHTRSSKNTRYPDGSMADYYSVIRTSKLHHIPGIIVEGAFITCPSDVKKYLNSTKKINKMAKADADGIAKALKLKKKKVSRPARATITSVKASGSDNSVTVKWKRSARASQYIIFRKTGAKGTFKEIGRTTKTSYKDVTGSYNTRYYYTVVSSNSSGRTDVYNKKGVGVTTPKKYTVTKIKAVDNGFKRVKVSWKKIKGAHGYRIYRNTNGGSYKTITTTKKNVSSYTDETVSGNMTYGYRVRAYFQKGKKKTNIWCTYQKNPVKVTTDSDGAGTLSGAMSADGKSIAFTWEKSTDPDVTYRLYKKTGDGHFTRVNDGIKENSYTETDLAPNTLYQFKFRFYRKSVNSSKKTLWSSYSNVLKFTTPANSGTPTNPASADAIEKLSKASIKWRSAYTAVKSSEDTTDYDKDKNDYVTPASETSLILHWYPVKDVSGYQIIDAAGNQVELVDGDDVNQVTINGLSPQSTYTYTIRAFLNVNGSIYYGPESSAASGTTAYTIKGTSSTNAQQMVRYYNSKTSGMNKSYPADVYKQYGAATIDQFSQIVCEEADRAGIKAEVLFAQICKETGFLQFGGSVKAAQCNFGGIGALDGGESGMDFVKYAKVYYSALGYSSAKEAEKNAVRVGIRAQATHLAFYAATDGNVSSTTSVSTIDGWPEGTSKVKIPDPRADSSLVGKAPYVEWLGIKDNHYTTGEAGDKIAKNYGWATANNYGYSLINDYITPLLAS